jgi:gentisate 1,2-dioxygenase
VTDEQPYTRARWDDLTDYPLEPLADDHPWPARDNMTLRDYFTPLRCQHLAFSIGQLAPGQSVEHHRHKKAEEVYLLLSGRSQIRIGEAVIEAAPLDAFRIPPEVERSVYNHSNEECRWLFMGAPVDEFLEE